MSLRRFRVAEDSMVPTLLPGDEFIANTEASAVTGQLVAALHPTREGFWLVKRLAAMEGDVVKADGADRVLGGGEAWLLSDNTTAGSDSRSFGPVPSDGLLPVVTRIDESNFAAAVDLLVEEDQALALVIAEHGMPIFWSRPPGFTTLTILIIEQQVSLESAAAVFRRLKESIGEVTPERLLPLGTEGLRSVGLTRQKAGYVLDLAAAVIEGTLDLAGVSAMETTPALGRLQELRGIGRWTAEAYLLAAEGRPDIFPIGDRALQVAAGEALGMKAVPDPDDLEILSAPWRPIRSVAARVLWHGYLSRRGRSEPVH
jgi:DNA-3-methyladenine glycosylase II